MDVKSTVRVIAVLGMIFSFAWPAVQERYAILNMLLNNEPTRMIARNAHVPNPDSPYNFKNQFAERVSHCEDVRLDEFQGIAILSCDPGRAGWNTVMGTFKNPKPPGALYSYQYASTSDIPKKIHLLNFDDSVNFHPLGLEFHAPSSTLYVVNHKSSQSGLLPFTDPNYAMGTNITIEVFKLGHGYSQATHVRTLSDPDGLLISPNSIHLLSEHELLVTNDHGLPPAKYGKILSTVETYLGPLVPYGPLAGHVTYVNLKTNESKKVARIAFPNGITEGVEKGTIVVASSAMGCLFVYDIDKTPGNVALSLKEKVIVPYFPDNLSTTKDGKKVLITGHPYPPVLEEAAKGDKDAKPWTWAQEWDGHVLRDIYIGHDILAGTTTVEDLERGVVLVAGLYGDGLLVGRGK